MAKSKNSKVKVGDSVEWNSQQGKIKGKVVSKKTAPARAGGHTAKASEQEPQYEVKSDKTGKTAIHKPESLKTISKRSVK